MLDNIHQSSYKQEKKKMIYQTIDYPTNRFLKTTKYIEKKNKNFILIFFYNL